MESRRRTGSDPVGAIAVVLTVGCAGIYLALVRDQAGEVAWWFLAGLAVAAALAAYGATRAVARRSGALMISAGILLAFGVLALPSVGLLLVAASVLALIAAARARREARSG